MKRARPDALPAIGGDGRSRTIGTLVAIALGQALAAAAAAFATRSVFGSLHNGDDLPIDVLAVIAVMGLAIAAARFAERVVGERLGQDYAIALRERLFSHVARMPSSAVGERRQGGLALRFVGDLGAAKRWISQGLSRGIGGAIVLPVALGATCVIAPVFGLVAVVPIALGLAASAYVGLRLAPAHRRLRARQSQLASDMLERVPAAPELRLLGRLARERHRLIRRSLAVRSAAMKRAQLLGIALAIPHLAAGCAAAGILTVAFTAGATPADAAGALAAIALAMHPLNALGGVWDRLRAWHAARQRCLNLLASPTLPMVRRPAADPRLIDANDTTRSPAPPRVRLRGVTAGPLNNVEASFGGGAKVALLGANGAGKSTLLRLLAGLDAPSGGRIGIGGVSPLGMRDSERRRTLVLLSERSPVLAGSLRRALTLGGKPRQHDDAILEVASRCGLAAVVERLGGLDGHVAEGARNLSSGEARRVLLARLVLARAPLWLLDEPEQLLDADGVGLLRTLLSETTATVIVATHHSDVVQVMDAIWRLDQGQLIDETHLYRGKGALRIATRTPGPSLRHGPEQPK